MLLDHQKQLKAGRMLLYLYIISVVMIFAGLTSAYLVRKAEGNWRYYELPFAFVVSTVFILASSLTHHIALSSAKRDAYSRVTIFLLLTLLLGISFAISQYVGWQQLVSMKVFLVGNPSESFLYIITGMHLLHMLGAMGVLIWATIRSFRYYFNANNTYGLELSAYFWHFLDFLWVYLIIFLSILR